MDSYTPENLFEKFVGDATKTIVTITDSTIGFPIALRVKGVASASRSLNATFNTGIGVGSVWVGCETESVTYDYLIMSVDGVQIFKIGGTVKSQQYFFPIKDPGVHSINFSYRKDESGDAGYDGGNIYNLQLPRP